MGVFNLSGFSGLYLTNRKLKLHRFLVPKIKEKWEAIEDTFWLFKKCFKKCRERERECLILQTVKNINLSQLILFLLLLVF